MVENFQPIVGLDGECYIDADKVVEFVNQNQIGQQWNEFLSKNTVIIYNPIKDLGLNVIAKKVILISDYEKFKLAYIN